MACDLGSDAAFATVDDSVRAWLDVHTGGLGADVVFVCVDTVEAIASGIGLVGSGGSIVAVGVGDRIDNLSITSLLVREADFRVSLGYSADDIGRVQALMQQDRLHVPPADPGTGRAGTRRSGSCVRHRSGPAPGSAQGTRPAQRLTGHERWETPSLGGRPDVSSSA